MTPKVFIVHASEDKGRFVLAFAAKLRSKGIDAWIDKWEILDGESLVNKIFEEGIGKAQCVIIVLSKHSANKPWVRMELDVSVVRKINEGIKLIPVILDIEDKQIPICLQATLWERIKDTDNYDTELERIIKSIYDDHSDKPPLGVPPRYVQTIIDILPDLTKVDTLIIRLSCDKAILIGHPHVDTKDILEQAKSYDIPNEEFDESIEILDGRGYIKANKSIVGITSFIITDDGFDKYARTYIPNYETIFNSVISQIVNCGKQDNSSIISSLNIPPMIIDRILHSLKNRGLIEMREASMGFLSISNVSPELKRILKV